MADDELMLAVRGGHIHLLSELFERHHRAVYGYVYRMTNSRETSEDLVQEVFLRILRFRQTYDPRQTFAAWMYGIARNAVIDVIRKRRPERSFGDDAPDVPAHGQLPDEQLRRRQESAILQRALASLPPDKREVLVLSRYQELRYDEIGRILGCETNAVKQRVFRAVKALGERFTELTKGAVA